MNINKRYQKLITNARRAHRAATSTPKGRKYAKRGALFLGIVVAFGIGHDAGVEEQARRTAPPQPITPTITVSQPAPKTDTMYTVPKTPKVWQEDDPNFPVELLLWGECNKGSCDLRHIRRYDNHKDCWMAVNETSYIMCTDGFRTTS
jgi:hypothetical protein